MRFACLGSGSRGNALLIESASVRLLVDCGFAARETERRLQGLGVDPRSLDAILVTHEHGDHIRGVGALARRYRLPVWMTEGTFRAGRFGELADLHLIDCHADGFVMGDLQIAPFPVPHDAREPCQFVFCSAGRRFGMLTDTGHVTPHILTTLNRCDALFLEFNHDTAMLASGPYPPHLQARVGGRLGHLSNAQSLALLNQLERGGLQHLLAAHLSEKNNHPERVREDLLQRFPELEAVFAMTCQDEAGGWREIA